MNSRLDWLVLSDYYSIYVTYSPPTPKTLLFCRVFWCWRRVRKELFGSHARGLRPRKHGTSTPWNVPLSLTLDNQKTIHPEKKQNVQRGATSNEIGQNQAFLLYGINSSLIHKIIPGSICFLNTFNTSKFLSACAGVLAFLTSIG